eukprot:jgi/Bigna1/143446/aug1.78_g18154
MKFIAGRRNIQTIEQDSALQPTATVRESLTFAALFKSKSSTTKSEIKEKVNLVMQSLKLSDKASCIIGGEGVDRFCRIEGLSGGERQRVAFAEHLLDDLSDIFILDEPTSSLDSNAAQLVVTLAKQLCHSVDIMSLKVIYDTNEEYDDDNDDDDGDDGGGDGGGSGGSGDSGDSEFFRGFGYGIPPNMCPAERYLELIQDISVTKNLAACAARNRVKGNRALSSTIGDTCNNDQTDQELRRGESMKEKKQRRNITHIEKMKASPSYYSSSAQKPLTGVFVIDYNEYDNGDLCSHGSDEGDEGKDYDSYDDDDDVSNHDVDDDFRRGRTYSCRRTKLDVVINPKEHLGAVEVALIITAFAPGFNSIAKFEAERRSVSMSIVWMTIELIMGVAFASSYHIISGLRQGTMFEFIVILVVFMLVNESIGLLCAVVTPSALLAIMLHTPPTVLMMLLGGNNIAGNGSILRYVNYINPYAYGMKYLATAEMNGLVFKGRHHTSGRLWVKTGEEFLGEHLKSEQSFMAAVFSLIGIMIVIIVIIGIVVDDDDDDDVVVVLVVVVLIGVKDDVTNTATSSAVSASCYHSLADNEVTIGSTNSTIT